MTLALGTDRAVTVDTVGVPGQPPEVDAGGVPVVAGGGLLVVAVALGVLVGWLLRGRAPRATARRTLSAEPQPPPPPARAPGADQARIDLLAAALIDLGDHLANEALVDRVRRSLRIAGWTVVDPVGEPFDPDHHRAVDRQATGDAALDQRVAATERPGYRDPSGAVVRDPEVVVYRYEPAASPGGPS